MSEPYTTLKAVIRELLREQTKALTLMLKIIEDLDGRVKGLELEQKDPRPIRDRVKVR